MRYSSYQPSFIAVETVVVPIKYTVKTVILLRRYENQGLQRNVATIV